VENSSDRLRLFPLYGGGFSGASGIAVGDLNRDGHLDVAIASWDGATVFLGSGAGTFSTGVSYYVPFGNSIAIGYGVFLMCEHRFDEASAQFTRAHGLDPLSPMIVLDLGQVRYYAGHYDAAIEQAQEVLAEDPHFAMAHDLLGMAYAREGRFPEALSEFQRYVELSGRDPDALMRLDATYAASGNRKRALDLAQEMESASDGNYVAAYDVSVVYAALGDRNRAFDWLGHAIDQRSSSCLLLAIDPSFEALRADPRFLEDLRRVGLAQAVSSDGA